jgi:hypothetical protein
MPTNCLTRRTALFSLGAVVSAGLSGCNTTPTAGVQPGAASGSRIGGFEVDTTPLVAYVGNPTAPGASRRQSNRGVHRYASEAARKLAFIL